MFCFTFILLIKQDLDPLLDLPALTTLSLVNNPVLQLSPRESYLSLRTGLCRCCRDFIFASCPVGDEIEGLPTVSYPQAAKT
jgi:Leucine-rich repeat (LRR) protein